MNRLIELSQAINGEIKKATNMTDYSEGALSLVFRISAKVSEEEFNELLKLKSANQIGQTDFLQIDISEYKEFKDKSDIVEKYIKYSSKLKMSLIEFFY